MSIEDLIPGKWYCWGQDKQHYFKFLRIKNNTPYFTECIYYKKYEKRNLDFWTFFQISECLLSEIDEYLPDNHPDKLINQIDNLSYVEPLIRLLKKIKN